MSENNPSPPDPRLDESSPDDQTPVNNKPVSDQTTAKKKEEEKKSVPTSDKKTSSDKESFESSFDKWFSRWGFSLGILWVLLIVGGALGGVWYYQNDSWRTISVPYMDFIRLVEQRSPTVNPNAKQQFTEERGRKRIVYEISGLKDLTVGPDQVTGKLNFRKVSVDGKKLDAKNVVRKGSADNGNILSNLFKEDGKWYNDRPFTTNRQGFTDDGNYLFNLLKEKGFINVDGKRPANSALRLLPSLLITFAFLALIVYSIRMMTKAGGAFAFGQSRGKFYKPAEIDITFKDVAGIDEAVEEVQEIVEFLKTPEKYKKIGGRIPKGVLLVGPPGTGKTLLAKAIAGEAGVPFVSISGSDFVEMFVGVGAARVRDMFEQAQETAPCIIFIDELDALGKTRTMSSTGGQDEREQTLNALLVEMDGFPTNNGVIVLAATNRPETLDPALLRPGRFDRHVLVDRPDLLGREAILKIYATKVEMAESVDLKEVASMTSGFAGADLSNLINEAALLAARAGKTAVSMDEINEGIERVTAGLQKKQRIMHPDEKKRVAYHESAHALVAHLLPNTDPVHKVSIIPRGLAALGYTLQRPEEDRYLVTQSQLESRIMVFLGGTIAEQLQFQDVSTGAQNDLQRATELARSMVMDYGMSRLGRMSFRTRESGLLSDEPTSTVVCSQELAARIDAETQYIMETAYNETKKILEDNLFKLQALAEFLLIKEVINNEDLRRILNGEKE